MAIFRKIHTSFWSDTFIQDLDNEHKLFYMYLLTNERTKQCGIYEISKKQMSFDLGYSIDRVSKMLKYFVNSGRIMYSDETKELAIKNWNKYNGSNSPKVISCIKSELLLIKDRVLIEYVNGMYTASQEEQEEEEEQEQKKAIYRSFAHLSITFEEFDKLSETYSKQKIDNILDEIENNANNKKYTSLYLTAKNWLKRNQPDPETVIVDPLVEYVHKTLGIK
jgi:hypothetical protein